MHSYAAAARAAISLLKCRCDIIENYYIKVTSAQSGTVWWAIEFNQFGCEKFSISLVSWSNGATAVTRLKVCACTVVYVCAVNVCLQQKHTYTYKKSGQASKNLWKIIIDRKGSIFGELNQNKTKPSEFQLGHAHLLRFLFKYQTSGKTVKPPVLIVE